MRWSRTVGFDPSLDEARKITIVIILAAVLTMSVMTTFSVFWFSLELQVGLLAACLPTLPGLFKDKKLFSSFRSRSNGSSFPTSSLKKVVSG